MHHEKYLPLLTCDFNCSFVYIYVYFYFGSYNIQEKLCSIFVCEYKFLVPIIRQIFLQILIKGKILCGRTLSCSIRQTQQAIFVQSTIGGSAGKFNFRF